LVNGIEGKISLDILECIHLHGKYDIYNNIFLSAAIKCNNFNVANYIQEKGEETVNALSYDSLLDDINTKSYQYMLNNGLYITSNLVQEIIKHNKFKFLNLYILIMILFYYYYLIIMTKIKFLFHNGTKYLKRKRRKLHSMKRCMRLLLMEIKLKL